MASAMMVWPFQRSFLKKESNLSDLICLELSIERKKPNFSIVISLLTNCVSSKMIVTPLSQYCDNERS